MDNVNLRQDALLKLNLPVNIELGMIKHLELKIPWINIGRSPVEIRIQGLNLIISPQKSSQWQVIDIFDQQYLEDKLLAAIEELKNQLSSQDNQGYFEKLAAKVVDNIQIKIEEVHCRFEDHFSGDQQYSFGLVMNLLEVSTTNENWIPKYIDRTQSGANKNLYKIARIEGFGLYLNPNDNIIIHQQTQVRENRIQMMDAVMLSQNELLKFILKPNQSAEKSACILEPRQVGVSINSYRINLQILKPQLKNMLKSYENVNFFHKVQNDLVKTIKFKQFRPMASQVTSDNARQWWQYAYLCIRKSNKSKKGALKEFQMNQTQLNHYESQFASVIPHFYKHKQGSKLSQEQFVMLRHILMALDFQVIKTWTNKYLKAILEKEKQSQEQMSFAQWLLSGRNNQQQDYDLMLNPDEIKELEKDIEKMTSDQVEIKSKGTQLHLNMTLKESSLELGIINEEDNIEGISIFAKDMQMTFKQNPNDDQAFDMAGSISDFGVDLYTFSQENDEIISKSPVIISNKRIFPQSLEEQWRIKIRKRPDDLSNVENDVDLQANPLVLLYNKEFIKRAVLISRVKLNEEISNAAKDRLEDWREATSSSIYSLIYKKSNRIRVNIASPVVVLPLTGDQRPDSPVWILRLGDLQIVSQDNNSIQTQIIEYERYEILLDSIRMQYYQTFSSWRENLENLKNFRDKTIVKEKNDLVFSVLEDCWMRFQIMIKQKRANVMISPEEFKKEYDSRAKVILQGSTSDIKVNLSHSLYNKLVNMGSIFDMSGDEEYNSPQEDDHIQSKQDVIKNAKKIGQVQKKLDGVKLWENYFCILSGNYLYFYKDAQQVMPSSYYYMKNCNVVENNEELGLPNNFVLKNRFGDCCLAIQNLKQYNDWIQKVNMRIYEIKQEDEQNFDIKGEDINAKKSTKKINHETIQLQVDFTMPSFKTLLVEELKYYQDWILLNFSKMKVTNVQRRTESLMNISMQEFQLIDLTMIANSSLISQKKYNTHNLQTRNECALEVSIETIQKSNPRYNGVDKLTDVKINNLNIKIQPVSINELFKFVRNTKPNKSFNLMQTDDLIDPLMDQSIVSDNSHHKANDPQSVEEQTHCGIIKETLTEYRIKLSNISFSLLHQTYHMDLYRMESTEIAFGYITKYDHSNIAIKFRDLLIYDLTGYPYTLDPKNFLENPNEFRQSQREFLCIKNDDPEGDQHALVFQYESYSSPKCLKKKEGCDAKLHLEITPLRLEYFQQSFMRFYSYFFEQFLHSMLNTDPYNDPKIQFKVQRSRSTVKKEKLLRLHDFKQSTSITEITVKMKDVTISVPDRPGSANFLHLQIDELNTSNSIQHKAKRLPLMPEKKIYVQCHKIIADRVQILHGENQTPITTSPFNFKMMFESPVYSHIIDRADPHLLEKASHLTFDFDPLEIMLPQNVYTSILRCVDLNINFQDQLDKQYYFVKYVDIEEFNKQLSGVISMRIKMRFKTLSLGLKLMDEAFLSELLLYNVSLSMKSYMDQTSQRLIKIENFYISEQESGKIKTPGGLLTAEQLKKQSTKIKTQFNPYVIQPLIENEARDNYFGHNPFGRKYSERTDKNNQIVLSMDSNATGDKDIKVEIQGVRITIKPHVLLMVYYFFINSFPKYEEDSIDKPSYYNFDPEDAPSMIFSASIQDSLICLQNKPGLKTIACQGKIFFQLRTQNIKRKKQQMLRQSEDLMFEEVEERKSYLTKNRNSPERADFREELEAIEELENDANMSEIEKDQTIVWHMKTLITDLCPFVCSVSQLNSKDAFSNIKKRQLFTPFNLSYTSKFELKMKKQPLKKDMIEELIDFGVENLTKISIQKMKMKMSLQDMHLFFLIVKYANENVSKEYLTKIKKLDEFAKANLRNSDLEKSCQDVRRETIQKDFGIKYNERRKLTDLQEEKEDEVDNEQFDKFFQNLQSRYDETLTSQVQRLRSTTKAFQRIAQQYTIVGNRQSTEALRKNLIGFGIAQMQGARTRGPEDFVSVFSKSNMKEDVEDDENKFQTIQPFFNETKGASKRKPQPTSQYTYTYESNRSESQTFSRPSEQLQSKSNSNKQNLLGLPAEPRRTTKVRKLTDFVRNRKTSSDDDFQDAKSEMFYSVNEQAQQAVEDEGFVTPRRQTIEEAPLSKHEIQVHSEPKQKVEYKNAMNNVWKQYFEMKSDGISILFINDYDNVFCPVLDFDIPEFQMNQDSIANLQSSTTISLQRVKAHYFNALLGDWEPFIENFEVNFEHSQGGQSQGISVKFPRSICINITEQCLTTLINTYNSWVEAPPYQYDDIIKRQKLINSRSNSIRVSQKSRREEFKNNSNSINQDQSHHVLESSQNFEDSKINTKEGEELKSTINQNEKITPYSLRNLTTYRIRVVSSDMFHLSAEITDNIETGRLSGELSNEDVTQNCKAYNLNQGDECEYAVDVEKQTKELMSHRKKRKNTQGPGNQSRYSSDLRRKQKQELVSILFEDFQPIEDIDLNKIQSYQCWLEPNETNELKSTPTEEDERLGSLFKKLKFKSRPSVAQEPEMLICGVALNKLRKIFTIRSQYVIHNTTENSYYVKIIERETNKMKLHSTLEPDQRLPLRAIYEIDHNIFFTLKNQSRSDLESNSDKFNEKGIDIEDLRQLAPQKGIQVEHNSKCFTFIQKVDGEFDETYDIQLVPPVKIMNAFPSAIDIAIYNNDNKQGLTKDEEIDEIITIEKCEEKSFPMLGLLTKNQDEVFFGIQIPGYQMEKLKFKKKQFDGDDYDQDVTIKDPDGNSLKVAVKISTQGAALNFKFFAYALLINHSQHKFNLHYDSINKPLVAAQNVNQQYCIINRDDSLLASIGERYSKSIKIKTVGVTDNFSIITQNQFLAQSQGSVTNQQKFKKYQYVYTSYPTLVVNNDFIYTKIVQIAPMFVMVNYSKHAVCVTQLGCEKQQYEVIEPNERREWVWFDSTKAEEICIKPVDPTIEDQYGDEALRPSYVMIPKSEQLRKWKWSESLDLEQLSLTTVEIKKDQNRFDNPHSRKLFKVAKKIIDVRFKINFIQNTNFIVFEDEDHEYPFYKIENTTQEVVVWFVQKGFNFNDEGQQIKPKSVYPYAFLDTKGEHILQCYIIFNKDSDQGRTVSFREEKMYEIDFERTDQKIEEPYTNSSGEEKVLHITVYTDGASKIIRFGDHPLNHEQSALRKSQLIGEKINSLSNIEFQEQPALKTTFNMEIKEILVSFITSVQRQIKKQTISKRKEIALMSIQEVTVVQYSGPEMFSFMGQIGSIQIDNQSQVKPVFPTILQPRLPKYERDVSMVELEINLNPSNPAITYVNEVVFNFTGMIIKCDDQFLGCAISFAYSVQELLKTSFTGTHPLFQKPKNDFSSPSHANKVSILLDGAHEEIKADEYLDRQRSLRQSQVETTIDENYKSWTVKKIPHNQKKIYINQCRLSSIQIEISFLARKGFTLGESVDTLQLQKIMNGNAIALLNIDEAPILIKEFHNDRLFIMQEDISSLIGQHYQKSLKENLLKLIFSTDLLGNIQKLKNTLSRGAYDFVNKPREQYGNGAGQVLRGSLYGTGSLVKNSVEGTFGFLQSFSSGMSKMALIVSHDKTYLSDREDKLLTEKPKNFVEGFGFGVYSGLQALVSGATGIFTQPYREIRDRGLIIGSFYGVITGAAGVVLKPMSGGLDFFSKTCEGIKNTAKIFDNKRFKDRRRLPRPIYGYQQQIKSYHEIDSYIINRILFSIKERFFEENHYIETIKFNEKGTTMFLILTEEHLILLDAHQKAIWWYIDSRIISIIDKLENGLILRLKYQFKDRKQVAIEINNKNKLDKIYERLKSLEIGI